MAFAVDTSKSRFLVVGEAEEYRQYDEDKPREKWEQRFDETASCCTGCSWSRWVRAGRS